MLRTWSNWIRFIVPYGHVGRFCVLKDAPVSLCSSTDLCLAQVFGMMPLTNVLSRSPHLVKFQLRSCGTCFSLIFLLLGGLKTMRLATKLFQGGLNAKSMGKFGNLFGKRDCWKL